MANFKITKKEWTLALIFGGIGIIISSRFFLLFLNKLNPFVGFLFYEGIVFLSLFLLSKLGLTVFDIKIEKISQVIGTTLIIFSFFVLFDFTSPYMQYVTQGNLIGASNIYTNNSEDGVAWYLWSLLFNNPGFLRILTYVVTPFLLTLLGGLLVKRKVKIGG